MSENKTKWHPEGRGPSTPWGSAQYTRSFGRGIGECGTAGHGGIRVSRALAEKTMLPAVLRKAIRQGGYYWFEEDCAYSLVVLSFPERFDAQRHEYAHRAARDWYPDEYTLLTGKPVALEESYTLQRRAFEAETRERFVVRSASGDWKAGVPKGMVEVLAKRASDGAEMTALVPADEYDARGKFGYVLPEAAA